MRLVTDRYIFKNRKTIAKGILEFIESPRYFDYEAFIKTKELVLRDVNQAAEFTYKVLGKDIYERFMDKALPFEPYFYSDNCQEKEELKERISRLAVGVKLNQANLIDILDAGFTNMHQYLAMVRQLSYKYKTIPATAYIENSEYLRIIGRYDDNEVSGTVKLPEGSQEEIKEIIKSRGLKANAITESAAFYYLRRSKQKNNAR